MKKILIILVATVLLYSCGANSGDDSEISSDKVVGTWKLISQKVNGFETINDCKKQTTFIFESSRVLRQVFHRLENNNCIEGTEAISGWFALGNSRYRISGSGGSRLVIELTFSEADTRYTSLETDINNTETLSIFEKSI